MPEPDDEPEEQPAAPGMGELLAKAIRPSMRLSVEDLLASELATAVLSDPIDKIRHICEGVMLLEFVELEKVGITEAEFKEAEKLYAVTLALKNAYVYQVRDDHGRVIELYATIAWPFPREEAKKWLNWTKGLTARHYIKDGEVTEWRALLKTMKWPEDVYEITAHKAQVITLRVFTTGFIRYAMPKCASLMRKLVSRVSLDAYLTALKSIRGKGRVRI